jgi:Zn-dependent protease
LARRDHRQSAHRLGYYDVALRDFGLLLAALTLGRLASKIDPPLFGARA